MGLMRCRAKGDQEDLDWPRSDFEFSFFRFSAEFLTKVKKAVLQQKPRFRFSFQCPFPYLIFLIFSLFSMEFVVDKKIWGEKTAKKYKCHNI